MLHQSLHHGPLSQTPIVTTCQDAFGGHICQLATMPAVNHLTIEHIYRDFTRRMISLQVVGGITVCDVLATAEELMVVDLERDTSNDPYGQTVGRRRDTVFPCQRRVTYFDCLRMMYGEAGLFKSQSGEDVWELRLGSRVTRESINYPPRSVVHQLYFPAF